MSARVPRAAPARKKSRAKTRRTPVQRRASDTVDALLQATAQILIRGGPAALSTNAVAARAGVSIGSLYQYFPNKQALVDALVARQAARMQPLLRATVAELADRPLEEGVTRLAHGVVAAYRRVDPRMAQLFHQLLPLSPTSPIDAFELELERLLADQLAGLPALRGRDPGLVAAMAVRAASGVCRSTLRREPERVSDAAFERELAALLLGYLQR